jgi:hypothetical protein
MSNIFYTYTTQAGLGSALNQTAVAAAKKAANNHLLIN